ncbi:uncharacterized protein BDV17DRAFT_18537 [Aspergillus undulatus]|uniref:uncharacterized protein n=1 Tax=Aspergillus undulatus TaxID=1810928 RepID=UPI003CCE2C11
MTPPEKHGGGYVPSLRLKQAFSFHFTRRSTTDQINERSNEPSGCQISHAKSQEAHQNCSTSTENKTTSSKPHGGGHHPHTSPLKTSEPAAAQPYLERPNRVTTMPHLHYRGESHGGSYVPQVARPESGVANGTREGGSERHGGGYVPSRKIAEIQLRSIGSSGEGSRHEVEK